ncbi:MAG: hypothetical protein GX838_03825 [Clostridiaceae bacterium]|nr:hypothetical protein [Clostridiaceae bacterium]
MDADKITYAFPKRKDVDPSCYIDAYTLAVECSQAHSPWSFSTTLLKLLAKACPYDEAVVIFLDVNGKISGWYTVGIKDEVFQEYLDMAEYLPEFSIYRDLDERSDFEFSKILNWSSFPKYKFIKDYIDGRGLVYSWGFCFFDLNGAYRVIFSLDRTSETPFSNSERHRLELALPLLNNMHRNFFYMGTDSKDPIICSLWREYHLTPREEEIATLLCQGMTVRNISATLYIAVTTTYKHLANIYDKLGVSSQQELIVKMLANQDC